MVTVAWSTSALNDRLPDGTWVPPVCRKNFKLSGNTGYELNGIPKDKFFQCIDENSTGISAWLAWIPEHPVLTFFGGIVIYQFYQWWNAPSQPTTGRQKVHGVSEAKTPRDRWNDRNPGRNYRTGYDRSKG